MHSRMRCLFCINLCTNWRVFLCPSADGKEESLLEKRRQLSREITKLKETHERLMSRFPNLRFDYK